MQRPKKSSLRLLCETLCFSSAGLHSACLINTTPSRGLPQEAQPASAAHFVSVVASLHRGSHDSFTHSRLRASRLTGLSRASHLLLFSFLTYSEKRRQSVRCSEGYDRCSGSRWSVDRTGQKDMWSDRIVWSWRKRKPWLWHIREAVVHLKVKLIIALSPHQPKATVVCKLACVAVTFYHTHCWSNSFKSNMGIKIKLLVIRSYKSKRTCFFFPQVMTHQTKMSGWVWQDPHLAEGWFVVQSWAAVSMSASSNFKIEGTIDPGKQRAVVFTQNNTGRQKSNNSNTTGMRQLLIIIKSKWLFTSVSDHILILIFISYLYYKLYIPSILKAITLLCMFVNDVRLNIIYFTLYYDFISSDPQDVIFPNLITFWQLKHSVLINIDANWKHFSNQMSFAALHR